MKAKSAAHFVRLYGVFHCAVALLIAWQTARFGVALMGVFTVVWAFDLAGRLNAGTKWAWFVTTGAALLFVVRYVVGMRFQLALWAGLTLPVEFSPSRAAIYLTGLILSSITLMCLLTRQTRVAVFAGEIE